MKVRIGDQRIVFRLNDDEKDELIAIGFKRVTLEFPLKTFYFVLKVDHESSSLVISESDNCIEIGIPMSYLKMWDEVNVGFNEAVNLSSGKQMNIIVEKDLKRSKRRSA